MLTAQTTEEVTLYLQQVQKAEFLKQSHYFWV